MSPTMTMNEDPVAAVRAFHEAFGHPVNQPQVGLDRLPRRAKWITEELAELIEAVLEDDVVGIADAVADALYFCYGTRVELGLKADETVHPGIEMDPDVRITMAWQSAGVLATQGMEGDVAPVGAILSQIEFHLVSLAASFDLPITEVLEKVHEANMAKLGPDGAVALGPDGKVVKPAGWVGPEQRIADLLGVAR